MDWLFDRQEAIESKLVTRHDYAELACERGHIEGCYIHGLYFNGTKRYSDAFKVFEQACEKGHAASCAYLGVYSMNGLATVKNTQAGAKHFSRGCDLGDGEACNFLGHSYRDEDVGTPPSYKALAAYRRACRGSVSAGSAWGCNNAATMRILGVGGAIEYGAAVPLYERACKDGFAWSCRALGAKREPEKRYLAEIADAPRDAKRAHELFRKACKASDRVACRAARRLCALGYATCGALSQKLEGQSHILRLLRP